MMRQVMKAVKWYRIGIPIGLEQLFQKIQGLSYSIERHKGFIIEEKRKNYILAKYIEEKKITKEIINPFGNIETIEFKDFLIISFKLTFENKWILEIYNKPRSIKPLTNQLSNMIGYGFYIEEVKLDLLQIIQQLELEIATVSIVKIELFNINIQNQALGQMLITSSKDIRAFLDNYLIKQTGYGIGYLKAHFNYHEEYNGFFELYSSSRLELHDIPARSFLVEYNKIINPLI